ncbi:hypothetical protein [Paenibacillus wulumuqiensis]|uniref:hypothetical protein n=1 Tax=Paenibacillus wulumuqiensis TaxID=1567107 RepID=UPI0006199B46|nr:hypothetical protein [Paenibacillus wulumuqiensis]
MTKQQTNDDTEFIFNVDLMITGPSNAVALQKLLEILNNQEELADFRIVSGIKLGKKIDAAAQIPGRQSTPVNVAIAQKEQMRTALRQQEPPAKPVQRTDAESAAVLQQKIENDMTSWLSLYIQGNQLIRLTINRRGERFSIPCRILKFDNEDQTISVYHVDEKQVYTFKLNEIDDFQHV